MVRTDPNKLERILLALLSNACKFTFEGAITLRVGTRTRGNDKSVEFEVQDTGIGIPSSQMKSIFDPFKQIDDSPTRNYSGSGLGLNISKRLSQLLGGNISVKSWPGKGASFVLSIPFETMETRPALDEDTAGEEAGRGHNRPLALIIDGNQEASDLIARHLVKLGCRVAMAADGIRGKEMALELKPDLVTLELEMQPVDGWAVLQHLQADSATRQIPVVICSNLDQRRAAFARDVAGYVIKPVAPKVFQDTLVRIPGIGQWFRAK